MKILKLSVIILCLITIHSTFAFSSSTEELEKRIELLEKQLQTLRQELAKQKEQKKESPTINLVNEVSKKIELHGIIEVEGAVTKGFDNSEESDVTLATAQLDVDAKLNDFASGKIVFLYEEDETDGVDIDEAYITIGNTQKFPVYLKAGKQYLPLGEFDTNMISDPLTLELAEINESAVSLGVEFNGFFMEGSIFNGDIDKVKKQNEDINHLDEFSVYGGYTTEIDDLTLNAWIGYMNNIADSDTISSYLEDNNISSIRDYVGGICANLAIDFKNLSLYASYAGATKSFDSGEINFKKKGAKPKAWNVELGYTIPIMDHEALFALGYQGTDEALLLEFPKHRYIGSVSVDIIDNLSLAVEYAYDKDYDLDDGGTHDDAHTFTTQLHFEF